MKRWSKLEDMFDERLAPSGMTFAGLREQGGWKMPTDGPFKPYRRHERGLLRPDKKPGFNTPSGKTEVLQRDFQKSGGWIRCPSTPSLAKRSIDA